MKSNLGKALILVLSISYFISCEESTCPEEYDMGEFKLLSSSKNLFPYDNRELKIVFSDSLGNEIIGTTVLYSATGYGTINSEKPCLNNSEQNIQVTAKLESINEIISIPTLDIGFKVEFKPFPNLNKYEDKAAKDLAYILFSNSATFPYSFHYPIPQIIILLNQRNDSEDLTHEDRPVPSFSIHGKVYQNVYTNNYGKDIVEIYYNHEVGIIGFKQKSTGILYGFKRFE